MGPTQIWNYQLIGPTHIRNTMTIPILRRKSRTVSLSTIGGMLSDGIATINETIEPRAQFWDEWNKKAFEKKGPLWIALGDSVTQGIGSSTPETSYVFIVLERLIHRSGLPWRVLNLSMSGGRFADVTTHQLPALTATGLSADLVTSIIGSNDIMWRRNKAGIEKDARLMLDALPRGTFLSKVSRSQKNDRRGLINAAFSESQKSGKVHLFNAWNWPTGTGMWAEDRFHPNDGAYKLIANNLWASLLENNDFMIQ